VCSGADVRFFLHSRHRRRAILLAALLSVCLCATGLSAQNVLVGDQTIESNIDSNSTGLAEAFPATATASAQVGSINFFVDESSTATKIYVGIYKDASGKPGTLLTQGSTTQLAPGTWNSVTVSTVSLTSGTAYWIAILGTTSGTPYFRDRSTTTCQSQTSSQSNLTSLPSTWSTGKTWNTCYISAYAVTGTYPATVIIGNQVVESNLDKNPAGQAEAFPATANTTGSVGAIALYLDPTSGSGSVYVGLYADSGGHPGSLLGQGNTASPTAGRWNQISIAASSVTAGQKYWIAVLGTKSTSPYFRDRQTTACKSQTSTQTTLTSLPATWSAGTSWSTCYISAYGVFGTGSPILSVTPSTLSFAAIQGGANPSPASLSVANTGTGTFTFTDSADATWLSATPTGGTAPQTLQVSASVGSLTAGMYTGHLTVTAAGAQGSPAVATVTFTVAPFVPPSISASASPSPNNHGWNNSTVTVTFTCTAGSYPVQTCPAPIPVSTQGANQVISGTVVDTAGNTNTAKVTLNIDLTAPAVSIGSPANGSNLTSSPATVTGIVSDSLSGVASVTCNGASATVQSGSYSCAVPLTAGADTIAVQATDLAGNTSSQSINAIFIVPATIGSFSPSSTSIGSLVTVQGGGFTQSGFSPVVTLNQEGGGTIVAPISSDTGSTISFVIPSGAASGPITVTVDGLTATSSSSLSIVGSSSFSLTTGPSSVTLLLGQTATVHVSLASSNGFSQLATLGLSGLPTGVTASFQPAQITAGQFSTLTLKAPATQGASSSSLIISASATVQGILETQSAGVLLNVQAPSGSATFAGQVAVTDSYNTPLVGVTVSFTGANYTGAQTGCTASTTTDGGGNFVLNGLSSSCTGSQMVQYNPATVTSPPGKYSGVTLSYVLTPGQVTTPGIIVHLPNVSNAETFTVSQNSSTTQTLVSKSIPGVTFTIYPGTTFSLPDGTQPDPFPLSVVEIPYDKIPDYMPPNPTEDPVFAMSIEPFNSSSSQPVALTFPNRKNTPPGTDMPLTSLNPTMGMMVNYGTGAVSSDGTQVIPDPDPANPGHLYGVSHFDWFFPLPGGGPGPHPGPGPGGGDPVDLASGVLIISKTDITFGGARGKLAVTRTYSGGPQATVYGPFGSGSSYNYNFALDVANAAPTSGGLGMINLVMPDGNAYPFAQQANGTYTNTTLPFLAGGVISSISNGGFSLRWKNGTVFQFNIFFQFGNAGSLNVALLTAITDANGNTTTVSRDQSGVLLSIIDPVGRYLNFTYTAGTTNPYIASITDSIGRMVQYTYNPSGTLATVTDMDRGVTTYGYDNFSNLTSITDPRGITYLQIAYDQNGRVTQQTTADGGVYTFNYTQLNPAINSSPVDQTIVTDARGNQTTYHFNPAGFILDVTDPLGQKTVYNINPASNAPFSFTDSLQRTIAFTYDSAGNIASITRLAGTSNAVTTSYTYDPVFNKITSATDALGHAVTFGYDPNRGNLTSVADALGNKVSFGYDNHGELSTATDPLGNTTQLSYINGDLVQTTDPLGRIRSRAMDAVSRPVSITNPSGLTEQLQFDNMNRLLLVTGPDGKQTSLSYDPNGNLLRVTDPNSHVTSYSYDSMDRLASETDALGRTETYQRDLNGNVIRFTDRRGLVSTFGYDGINRIMSAVLGGSESIQYSYAGPDLLQAADSVGGSVVFGYDGLDRVTSQTTSQGSVSYSYDAANRRTGMSVSGQAPIGYGYDNANRLIQETQGSSTVSFAYDANGQRQSITLPNSVVEMYSYNTDSHLSGITYLHGSQSLGTLSYTRDPSGLITSVGGTLAQTSLPSQVTSASYGSSNQIVQFGSSSFTYDANGNLTSDGVNSYVWDARNQLVSISGSINASFQYDAFGRRVARTEGLATTNYLYDGLNPVQELSGGVPSVNLLFAAGLDSILQQTTGSGAVDFLTDALGSVIASTGPAGTITTTYSYDPFGNTTASGSSPTVFEYTGRENDGDGLYYLRARYYSPGLQRFLSEDPAGIVGGINLYGYVGNSPLNMVDPRGKDPVIGVPVGILAGGLFGALGAGLQGGDASDIAAAAIGGALAGGVAGLFDPSMGVGTVGLIVVGAVSGGAGDFIGQTIVLGQDTSGCKTYNWASTAGAVVGGAVTGVGAAVTPLYQASLELAELPATVLTSTVSGLGGTASGALVTQTLSSQQQQSSPKCGCH
jgi:RHS repeat-associated protein